MVFSYLYVYKYIFFIIVTTVLLLLLLFIILFLKVARDIKRWLFIIFSRCRWKVICKCWWYLQVYTFWKVLVHGAYMGFYYNLPFLMSVIQIQGNLHSKFSLLGTVFVCGNMCNWKTPECTRMNAKCHKLNTSFW